jgi:hypothetical protein
MKPETETCDNCRHNKLRADQKPCEDCELLEGRECHWEEQDPDIDHLIDRRDDR